MPGATPIPDDIAAAQAAAELLRFELAVEAAERAEAAAGWLSEHHRDGPCRGQ